ncbi:MAG: pilus assembly protein [Proteobacteria bacterium]|nr:pilus assembly protein [Pseudomonadota bacterium]
MKRGNGGALMVEFALVSAVLLLLLGALFDFGRVFFVAQQGQRSVHFAARELALLPLPPTGISLADALACRRSQVGDPAFPQCAPLAGVPVLPREAIFDPDWLAVSCETLSGLGFDCRDEGDLDAFVSRLPVVNQMLWPLMIWDRTDACPDTRPCLIRYPGALFTDTSPGNPTGFQVQIPVLDGAAIRCVPAIEAIENAGGVGSFPVERGGLVALRWNFPFQAASLLGGRPDGGVLEPIDVADLDCPALAAGLSEQETLGPLPVLDATPGVGPHAGPLGLGRQLARARELRPFRRVLSTEALARRELFQ